MGQMGRRVSDPNARFSCVAAFGLAEDGGSQGLWAVPGIPALHQGTRRWLGSGGSLGSRFLGKGVKVGATFQAVLEAKQGRNLGGEHVCCGGDFHLSLISSVWGFSCCVERSNQNTNHTGVTQAALSASN